MRLLDDSKPEINVDKRNGVRASEGQEGAISLGSVPVGVYLGMVVLLAVLLNLNTLGNALHLDDMRIITSNRSLATPSSLLQSLSANPSRALLLFSFGYNLWLGGLNPVGFHLVNIALHAAVCVLVFFVVLHFARNSADLTRGTIPPRIAAFAAAALFACHPLNSETVNYISARSSSMAAMFYLLAFLSFINYTKAGARHTVRFWYVLSMLSFVLGLASKEIVVTLPVMLLVYDLIYVGKFRPALFVRRLAWPHGPYWVVVAGVLAFHLLVVGLPSPPVRPVLTNLLTQTHVVLNYLQLALVPVGLTFEYSVPTYSRLFEPTTILAVVTICAMVTLATAFARKLPALSFAIFWYFVTLVPSSSIVPLTAIMSEHRAYLPMSGLVIMFPMAVAGLLRAPSLYARRREVGTAVAVLLAALSTATVARNRVWRSDITMWNDAVTKSPSSSRAQSSFGRVLVTRGYATDAIEVLERAVELDPGNSNAHSTLGFALERLGRFDEAVAAHERALELEPADAQLYVTYGATLSAAGRFDESVAVFRQAIELDPGMSEAYVGLCAAYRQTGRFDEAVRALERAAELYPANVVARAGLREMHIEIQAIRRRKTQLIEMVAAGNNEPETYNELGAVYLAERKLDRAEDAFRQALDKKPSYGPALINLGNVRMLQDRSQDAILLYQQAARIDEFAVSAYGQLASAYLRNGRQQEAKRALESLEKVSGRQFPSLRNQIESSTQTQNSGRGAQ